MNQIIRSRSKSPVRQIPRTCQVSYFKAREQKLKSIKQVYFHTLESAFVKLRSNLLRYSIKQINRKIENENQKMKVLKTHCERSLINKTFQKWCRQFRYFHMSQSLNTSPKFRNTQKSSPKVSEFRVSTVKKQSTLTARRMCNALIQVVNNNKRCVFTIYKIYAIRKVKKRQTLHRWYKNTYKRLLVNLKLSKMVGILNKQILQHLKCI